MSEVEDLVKELNYEFTKREFTIKCYINNLKSPVGEQARLTWQNLLDTFRKKYKIQNDSKRGQEATASDKWPYLKSMLFLKDMITPGPSSGNLYATEKENEPSAHDRSPTTASEKSTNDGEMCLSSEERKVSASSSSSVKADRNRPKRHVKTKDYDSQVLDIEKRKVDRFEQHVSRKQKHHDDDDYSFFMSLLPSVKELDQLEKMRLRKKILGDVTKALQAHNFKNDERSSSFIQTQSGCPLQSSQPSPYPSPGASNYDQDSSSFVSVVQMCPPAQKPHGNSF